MIRLIDMLVYLLLIVI